MRGYKQLSHTLTDGIVQDEQIFMLIFSERVHQCVEDEGEVLNQLGAGLFLKGSESTV